MQCRQLLDNRIFYYPHFLPTAEADAFFTILYQQLQWRQEAIHMFGRKVQQPRLQAWYGDAEAHYRYSGLQLQPLPWTDSLQQLRQRLQTLTGESFNSVLANLYRDGKDYMGWHADDEKELGQHPLIASISLGAERSFHLKPRPQKNTRTDSKIQNSTTNSGTNENCRLELQHGSLLLMTADSQQHWLHSLPKRLKVPEPRINLTFRLVRSD